MESSIKLKYLIPLISYKDQHILMSLQLQGLSILDREPLFVGVSVSSLEKAFRVVDIGPNPENKEEVFQFFFWWWERGGGGGVMFFK